MPPRPSALILLVTTTVLPFVVACSRTSADPAPPPPPTVSVVQLTPETIEVSSEWVATLDGLVNAAIRPQVSGYLIARTYREGAVVGKGDVLFEIDPRPFEATLAMAQANLARDQAQLANAQRNVGRDKPLLNKDFVSHQQYDTDAASVAALEGTVKADEAQIDSAQLQLDYATKIGRAHV